MFIRARIGKSANVTAGEFSAFIKTLERKILHKLVSAL